MASELEKSTINATGNATALRPPDIALISLFVLTNGILMEDAIQAAQSKSEQVSKTLLDSFPTIQDIQIRDIYIGESNSYTYMRGDKGDPAKPEVIKGLLVLTAPEPELAIKIVDTASRMGCIIQNPANDRISSYPRSVILYGLSDYEAAEREAIESALQDAERNANMISRALTRSLGKIHEVSSVEMLRLKTSLDEYRLSSRSSLPFPTSYLSVSPEHVEVSVKVSVKFELGVMLQ